MTSATDYSKEAWKHPACWRSHLVRMTRDYPEGKPVSVATCECGWVSRMSVDQPAAQNEAVNALGKPAAVSVNDSPRRH